MDRQRFEQALIANMGSFDVQLSDETVTQLGAYYSLLTKWNDRLHLVAPCAAEEFATRHVLESLLLLRHLPQGAKIADIGSGAGLPIIPCLIARPDLEATLIESSQKKAVFLREALNTVSRPATVIARPFEDIDPPDVAFITCRALDQFIEKVLNFDRLVSRQEAHCFCLVVGLCDRNYQIRIPGLSDSTSTKRFLFVVSRSA